MDYLQHGGRFNAVQFYAKHLSNLISCADEWVTRRITSHEIIDGDTIKVHVRLEFDLLKSAEGSAYIGELGAIGGGLTNPPLLLPIGFYPEPYIGFKSRVRLVGREEREILGAQMPLGNLGIEFAKMVRSGHLMLAEVPLSRDDGRGVLRYTYLRAWSPDKPEFEFYPPFDDPKPMSIWQRLNLKYVLGPWRRYASMRFGLRPLRVTIPVMNAYLSDSCHTELHAPAGIRVHRPEIVRERDDHTQPEHQAPKQEVLSEPISHVPPSHAAAILHRRDNRKEGRPGDITPTEAQSRLVFRAWLSLDKYGLTTALAYLAGMNLLVCVASLIAAGHGRLPVEDFVLIQTLVTGVSFVYIYLPNEHGLSRGLFSWPSLLLVLVASAALGTSAALTLKATEGSGPVASGDLTPHNPYDAVAILFIIGCMIVVVSGTLILFGVRFAVDDGHVETWLKKRAQNGAYKHPGWHVTGYPSSQRNGDSAKIFMLEMFWESPEV